MSDPDLSKDLGGTEATCWGRQAMDMEPQLMTSFLTAGRDGWQCCFITLSSWCCPTTPAGLGSPQPHYVCHVTIICLSQGWEFRAGDAPVGVALFFSWISCLLVASAPCSKLVRYRI